MPGPNSFERHVGEAGVDLLPVRDLALGGRGSQIFFSCAVVMQSTRPFLFATTVSASLATCSSVYSMPCLLADLLLLGLDRTGGIRDVGPARAEHLEAAAGAGGGDGDLDSARSSVYSSAAADVSGSTVEEPSTTTSPETLPLPPDDEESSWPPHADSRRSTVATGTAARRLVLRAFTGVYLSGMAGVPAWMNP